MLADRNHSTSLRFPNDDSPGEGLTAGLRKGVCMFASGSDLSEEGLGFGVPVIVSRWRTYLSFTAPTVEISSDGTTVKKVFHLDAVQRVGQSDGLWPYVWLEAKGLVYKGLPWAQRWLLAKRATGNLTPNVGFFPVRSRAEVIIEYRLGEDNVQVEVDLTGLTALSRRDRVYILNEQGGRAFPIYREDGRVDSREHRSGWAKVSAESAGFAADDGSRWFNLRAQAGAAMFRGREVVDGQLSWSGIEYDLSDWPGDSFSYRIEVGGPGPEEEKSA